MNARRSIELTNKFAKCPECGSERIGNGMGTLVIEENRFIRSCKCGYKVIINDDVIDNKVKGVYNDSEEHEYYCPHCKVQLGGYDSKNEDGSDPFYGLLHCPWCGTELDWSDTIENDFEY